MEIKDEHLAKLLLGYDGTTLVCTEENHYKFWNVVPDKEKAELKITWGRIGQKTQSTTKPWNSNWQLQDLINKKLKKGYEYIA